MVRKLLMAFGAAALFVAAADTGALAFGEGFAGPGPAITGNNTGGIFPYHPAPPSEYEQIAEAFCARYGRLAKITSVHEIYGDYVSFVCYDRRGMIH